MYKQNLLSTGSYQCHRGAKGKYNIFFSKLSTAVVAAVFTPVQNIYTSGSGTEIAPVGATSVTVEVWSGGGGGPRTSGTAGVSGGGSGKATNIRSISGGDTCSYSVGSGGAGRTGSSGTGTNGTESTVNTGTGGFAGINMTGGFGSGSIVTGKQIGRAHV